MPRSSDLTAWLFALPDTASVQRQIVNHCIFTLARTRFNMDNFAGYNATALAVRDRLLESWNPTQQHFTAIGCKRVYYMSLEFLLGCVFF